MRLPEKTKKEIKKHINKKYDSICKNPFLNYFMFLAGAYEKFRRYTL